jgi:site-specific recombinase XerD
MTESHSLILPSNSVPAIVPKPPDLIAAAGTSARFAWAEFFAAQIRNPHTRAAYGLAVRRFFAWLEPKGIPLASIEPAHVGTYFAEHPGSVPTKKLHLSAIRSLFDLMVVRHAVLLNPAASVRDEKYQVVEGKTPEITIEQARTLIAGIRLAKPRRNGDSVTDIVGLRDRAIIGVLIYTAARAGAVAKLQLKHLVHDGALSSLRFNEKGGKSREIPVQHDDLERFILEYLDAAGIRSDAGDSPLFRSAERWSGQITGKPITNVDICRMIKRRLAAAGLPSHLSPHSFRVTTITDLLTQGVPLEDVQYLSGHADPRTTRLYDRRQKRVTRNIVERISI